jgi:hypothetical protein
LVFVFGFCLWVASFLTVGGVGVFGGGGGGGVGLWLWLLFTDFDIGGDGLYVGLFDDTQRFGDIEFFIDGDADLTFEVVHEIEEVVFGCVFDEDNQ